MDDAQRQRYATIGSAFLSRVAQRLSDLDPSEISAAQLPGFIRAAQELQQLGEPREDLASRRERVVQSQVDALEQPGVCVVCGAPFEFFEDHADCAATA